MYSNVVNCFLLHLISSSGSNVSNGNLIIILICNLSAMPCNSSFTTPVSLYFSSNFLATFNFDAYLFLVASVVELFALSSHQFIIGKNKQLVVPCLNACAILCGLMVSSLVIISLAFGYSWNISL